MDKDNKILDELLEIIKNDNLNYGGRGEIAVQLTGNGIWLNTKYGIDTDKYYELLDKLVYDGYIIDNRDLQKYQLTIPGKDFLKNGGYRGEKLRNIKKKWFIYITKFIIPLLGVLVLIFFTRTCNQEKKSAQQTDKDSYQIVINPKQS
jgi:hypothetical protein